MIDQINELPEDGVKSSPETSRYTENKWIYRKNYNKLHFLHLVEVVYKLEVLKHFVHWEHILTQGIENILSIKIIQL